MKLQKKLQIEKKKTLTFDRVQTIRYDQSKTIEDSGIEPVTRPYIFDLQIVEEDNLSLITP